MLVGTLTLAFRCHNRLLCLPLWLPRPFDSNRPPANCGRVVCMLVEMRVYFLCWRPMAIAYYGMTSRLIVTHSRLFSPNVLNNTNDYLSKFLLPPSKMCRNSYSIILLWSLWNSNIDYCVIALCKIILKIYSFDSSLLHHIVWTSQALWQYWKGSSHLWLSVANYGQFVLHLSVILVAFSLIWNTQHHKPAKEDWFHIDISGKG